MEDNDDVEIEVVNLVAQKLGMEFNSFRKELGGESLLVHRGKKTVDKELLVSTLNKLKVPPHRQEEVFKDLRKHGFDVKNGAPAQLSPPPKTESGPSLTRWILVGAVVVLLVVLFATGVRYLDPGKTDANAQAKVETKAAAAPGSTNTPQLNPPASTTQTASAAVPEKSEITKVHERMNRLKDEVIHPTIATVLKQGEEIAELRKRPVVVVSKEPTAVVVRKPAASKRAARSNTSGIWNVPGVPEPRRNPHFIWVYPEKKTHGGHR